MLPPEKIKFYQATGSGLNKPQYYAAYTIEAVRYRAYADCNCQFVPFILEGNYSDIPTDEFIKNARLSLDDAHWVSINHDPQKED